MSDAGWDERVVPRMGPGQHLLSCSLLIVASVSNHTDMTLHDRNLKKFGPEWKCVMLTHSQRTDFPERCDVIRHYNTFWGQILHMSLGQISRYGCGTKLLMLDDVDILDLDVPRLKTFASQHRLDVASPTLRGASHRWMQEDGRNGTEAEEWRKLSKRLPRGQFVELYATLLSPLAWLTFSKLLELIPNGKGWGYDICLGRHLASGVDTSQHVLHMGSHALGHATGELKAELRRERAELRRTCTTDWFTKLSTEIQPLALEHFDAEFKCQSPAVTSTEARCIGVPCPLQYYNFSGCRGACAARRDCLSFSIDEHGNCFLKDRALVVPVSPSDPLYALQPKGCLRNRLIDDNLPVEALADAELTRWIVKPGQTVPKVVTQGAHGTFERYESSDMELTWLTGDIAKGTICEHARKPAIVAAAQVWVDFTSQPAVWAPAERPAPTPKPHQDKVLSHFLVQGHMEPIEPLHGVARHPFGVEDCAPNATGHSQDPFNLTYLLVHNDCGRQKGNGTNGQPKPRVLLFDMGASMGFKGIPSGIPTSVVEGGFISPSLPLFWKLYKDRCLEPDAVFCWELDKRVTGSEWWGDLGPEVRHKVRFFEAPVMEGELHEAMAGTRNPNSFLQMLQSVARPEDFVAVKLDIDTPAIEQTVIGTLTQRPDLAALIDELFFEYHFHFDNLDIGWGPIPVSISVDAALATMHRLRELGIRAHFWV
jgi:hypothetical protein